MRRVIRCLWILVALVGVTGTLHAQVTPQRSEALTAKSFQHPDLKGEEVFQEVGRLPLAAAAEARQRLADLGIEESTARLDARSGRFVTLFPTAALIPGAGYGNTLRWSDFNQAGPPQGNAHTAAAWQALLGYLSANRAALGIDRTELTGSPRSASHDGGEMIQFHIARQLDGIPVRGSHINATIKKGNLILLGVHRWANRGANSGRKQLSEEEATAAARKYLDPLRVDGAWGEAEKVYLTLFNGNSQGNSGYRYQLAWAVRSRIAGDGGSWETLVNANTGEIMGHQDLNRYAEAEGGVYPVTNDGIAPDGVEQAGWPMPFMFVGSATTDTGGNYSLTGNQTATFNGPFVNMADNCGTDSLTQSGGIDWGTSGGDDCTTPGFGGAGNTHASRSGFYELNRIKEMARSHLPTNNWLQNRLTANMNINLTCNAFWNGSTVNFYRSGGGCANTGEIAAVFDHEWAHGMDQNDVNGGIASPSGEGIADIYSSLRLNDSCIGRNFRTTVCDGFGDPCLTCTGVRDIDYLARQSGNPHDYSWSNANCGGSVHCVGSVYAEAVWSLWKRELQSAPYNYDNNTAHEIVTRMTYIAAGVTGTWFSGGPPNGGCSGTSGYMNYLTADDDDGNLNNGTPHMVAIHAAFDDQEIACNTPTVQDSGCSGVPTSAPNVTATPGNNSIGLSWGSVSGASSYEVFRAEGIFNCDFGKVRIGETAGTSFTDVDLQNGRDYSYVVIPKGSDDACFGPASACDTVQPADGPECADNDDCDDGLFCNGSETCNAGSCVAGSDPCPAQGCDEVNDVCTAGGPCTHEADFEGGADGWTNGADTCTTGSFVVGSPDATAWQVAGGNPGNAYFTQLNGGGLGTDDVDGGTCEALSPVIDCDGNAEADISIDYYHGQRDAGDDSSDGFSIEVLSDGVVVDTMVVIGDVTNTAAWTTVSTTVSNPGNIQIRVRATDAAGPGDIVEGGIDNVSISPSGPACTDNTDCDDGAFCNGAETCNAGTCQGGTPPACDDGAFCNGTETCNEGTNTCDPGTPPACDDGAFCNGTETCNETTDTCDAGTPPACDDGTFCNGAETCNEGTDTCDAGTPPGCDDGVGCTDDSCNVGTDSCDNVANNALCPDDGAFCNGTEFCDASLDCQSTGDPCSGSQICNESTDICEDPPPGGCSHSADFEGGAGGWIDNTNGPNGPADPCSTGFFVVGTPDATTWQLGSGNPGDAFFTQPNPGGIGTDDVDNGTCEALSPTVDCSGAAAADVSLDYYHGQRDNADGAGDGFTIEVLNDGVVVTTMVAIGDVTNNPAWTNVSTTVANPGNIQVRVRASDATGAGDIVEGGIDNVVIAPGVPPPPCTVDDDFESGTAGWTNEAASTCTTGDYVTGNPTNPSGGFQIVGSHSGVTSIFTATNSTAGNADVDGGNCILGSPTWAVSNASTLSVWYWHGQRDNADDPNGGLPNGDGFALEYSTDGGSNWTTMASNGDSPSNPVWTNATASISAGSNVQLRVQCSDGSAAGDLVECGIDDVSICE